MATQDLVKELKALIGSANVRSDATALSAYSHDATPLFDGLPEVILTPTSTEDQEKQTNPINYPRRGGSSVSESPGLIIPSSSVRARPAPLFSCNAPADA